MERFSYEAADESQTAQLGAALARVIPDGTVVSLRGTLGAGKTRLVQAIAEAEGVNRQEVVSPTFVLLHEYAGKRPIYHFDAYRLRDEDEFQELGPEEYFESGGVSLVEWAERVVGCLPRERIDVRIEVFGETSRRFEIEARGARYEEPIRRLKQILAD